MKTNAKPEIIVKAVEEVSKRYGNNIVFQRQPQKLTKNVCRFTLRTKDRNGPGSRVSENGKKLIKASWQVHVEVFREIFKHDTSSVPFIHIDTLFGRFYRDSQVQDMIMSEMEGKKTLYSETAEEEVEREGEVKLQPKQWLFQYPKPVSKKPVSINKKSLAQEFEKIKAAASVNKQSKDVEVNRLIKALNLLISNESLLDKLVETSDKIEVMEE